MMIKKFLQLFIGIFTAVLLFVALVIPNRLSWVSPYSFAVIPAELLLLGWLVLLPGRGGLALRWIASAILAAGIIFKIADMATYNVFARPFSPVFDAYLLMNGMDLLHGILGKFTALVVAAILILTVIFIVSLAFHTLSIASAALSRNRIASSVVLTIFSVVWIFLWAFNSPRASTQFLNQMTAHLRATHQSIQDIDDFKTLLANRTGIESKLTAHPDVTPVQQLFEILGGKDVLMIFIESYGRTVFDKPEFSMHIQPLMQNQTEKLQAAGISTRSAWLTSPTVGGLSWLAHGTAMSGLWINSQLRYDTLVMSQHPSLNNLFRRAGWRSVGVMPAITMAWPEGNYFGYDQLYHAHNSGYEGEAFNWVTMPDQFTLAAFQRNELHKKNRPPVMAEIALISSHAPWTPVPRLVDWNKVGDGKIFNEQATSGDTPETVWRDPERIRLQFRLSIEYTLTTLVDYLLTFGNDNLVVIAFGDHQPAPLVTGDSDNRDVPVHFFARDPKIIDAISAWQWTEGLIPSAGSPVWGMDEVRERFIETFSPGITGEAER